MDAERFQRLKEIVYDARAFSGEARLSFLREACDGDETLLDDALSLLAHDRVPAPVVRTGALERGLGAQLAPHLDRFERGDLPETIGAYRLLDVLGEGGMGVVVRARQTQPIQRDVAIKLIKGEASSQKVVARFEAERQALALMNHPNIANVYEAATDERGRPYFVMELVDGAPITAYCDDRGLDVRQRLAIFLDVCQGVQHAHQRGVIHRDLKPSNIVVATEDGAPTPKVIDFGIAKAVGEPLTDHTQMTVDGQVLGTPDYMSPEQAGTLATPVDTRTDVYALGVVLYELLCGRRMQRPLAETEPQAPSVAAGSTQRALAGDLDRITLMALRKEPERRYQSVEALADDLQRFLAGLPVTASGDTWSYRAGKFVRRHRAAVTAAVTAAVLLMTFAVVMAIQSAQTARQRDRAEAAEKRARAEAETATAVSRFLVDLFEVSDPGESRGQSVTAREILDAGAVRVAEELADQPVVQSHLMDTIGSVYQSMGLGAEARPLLEEGLAIRRRALGPRHADVAESLRHLGKWHLDRGEFAESEAYFREALSIRAESADVDSLDLAESQVNVALVLLDTGDMEEATALFRAALGIRQRLLPEGHEQLGSIQHNLGAALYYAGDYDAAVPLLRQALDILEPQLGADHPRIVITRSTLGLTLREAGRTDEAVIELREALERSLQLWGPDNQNLAPTMNNLALALQDQGDYAGAEPLLRDLIALDRRHLGADSPYLATSHANLGVLLHDMGKYAEAEPHYDASLDIRQRVLGADHLEVARALNNRARLAIDLDDLPTARTLLGQAKRIVEKDGSEHPVVATTWDNLGRLEHAAGEHATALGHYERGLALRREWRGADHPAVAMSLANLARLHLDRGDVEAASVLAHDALERRLRLLGEEHPDVALSRCTLAGCLWERGDAREAARLFVAGLESLRQTFPAGHPDAALPLAGLARIELASGAADAAQARLGEAVVLLELALPASHPRVVQARAAQAAAASAE